MTFLPLKSENYKGLVQDDIAFLHKFLCSSDHEGCFELFNLKNYFFN
jgi:hypothetical protein